MGSLLCFFRDKSQPKIIIRRKDVNPELYQTNSKNPYIDIIYRQNKRYIVNINNKKKIF